MKLNPPLEDNYVKYINNNNTDDEIKARINNIRIMLTKLDNIGTKNEKNIVRMKLYKIENKKRPTKAQKERIHACLIELARTLESMENINIITTRTWILLEQET